MIFLVCCIGFMLIVYTLIYYLGIKVSYSFILYNQSITFAVGSTLYLIKLLTMVSAATTIVFVDVMILSMFLIVLVIASIEAIIIDVFEQSHEMKKDAKATINYVRRIFAKWKSSALEKIKIKKDENPTLSNEEQV